MSQSNHYPHSNVLGIAPAVSESLQTSFSTGQTLEPDSSPSFTRVAPDGNQSHSRNSSTNLLSTPPQQHARNLSTQTANSNQQTQSEKPSYSTYISPQPQHTPTFPPQTSTFVDTKLTTPGQLGEAPATIFCPKCHAVGLTKTKKEAGDAVTLWATMLCCLTCATCAWVPCVMASCKDTVHRCSSCDIVVASVSSGGSTTVPEEIRSLEAMPANQPPQQQLQIQPQQSMEYPGYATQSQAPATYDEKLQDTDATPAPQELETLMVTEADSRPIGYSSSPQGPIFEMPANEVPTNELPASSPVTTVPKTQDSQK